MNPFATGTDAGHEPARFQEKKRRVRNIQRRKHNEGGD